MQHRRSLCAPNQCWLWLDPPQVCQFKMEGVPGHSLHSTTVTHGIFGGSTQRYERQALASGTSPGTPEMRAERKSSRPKTAPGAAAAVASTSAAVKKGGAAKRGSKRPHPDLDFSTRQSALDFYNRNQNSKHKLLDDIAGACRLVF